jgi:putative transposase
MALKVRTADRTAATAAAPPPSDRWHLDEMVVRIVGKRMYLWRAVDHEGEVLDMLVQSRRDSRAALRLMRKLLRKQGFVLKLLVTDRSVALLMRAGQLQLPERRAVGAQLAVVGSRAGSDDAVLFERGDVGGR